MKLTSYELKMLNGEFGEFKQKALEKIIQYAGILGADELCEVTKATVYVGAHPYLDVVGSDCYDEIFSKMYMCSDKTIKIGSFAKECFTQTCVAPCDQYCYKPLGLTKEFFDKNNAYLEITKNAGACIAGSCTPYFTGWLPLMGEHFVTTESSNVVMCNSILGACGNSDGLEAAVWSAVCGRTPKWGNHIMENRLGTHVFNINCDSSSEMDWDLIGYTVGKHLPPHAIPIISGNFKKPNIIKLKQCFASLATTSGAEMCHIVGVTPEAKTLSMALGGKNPVEVVEITQAMYDKSYSMLCDDDDTAVEFVTLGCPHYSLEELRDVAGYMEGKKVKDNILMMVWTDISTKAMSDVNGFTKIIEDAGGHVLT
ncbi:MAG: aconitase X catalytic domain-containing protein, partial [Oscillospiraceae bacterium]